MPRLAKKYGVSEDSLFRHKRSHLPPQLRAKLLAGPKLRVDVEKLRQTEGQSLLSNIVVVRTRLYAALAEAEEREDLNAIALISGRLHNNFNLTGQLIGQLGGGAGSTTVNVFADPRYLELRTALVGALRSHPEAGQAVAAVLHQLEHRAADAARAEAAAQYADWSYPEANEGDAPAADDGAAAADDGSADPDAGNADTDAVSPDAAS